MTPSRITALVVAAFVALPGTALAAHHSRHARSHRVHTSVSVPQPTIVVPHKYDAGGDGGEVTTPAGLKVGLSIDVVGTAQALGNGVLTQLGLPPLPTL
ncbi:MAG: hypothetical protein ACJ76Z_01990 [Thermoleophilaceae bacterium]